MKKRGGQAGNLNALRHGLYSKHFIPEEVKRLELMDDLTEEIAVLRVILSRLMALAADEVEGGKLSTLAMAMADCAAKIGNLYRTRGFLDKSGETWDVAERLVKELQEAMASYNDSSNDKAT